MPRPTIFAIGAEPDHRAADVDAVAGARPESRAYRVRRRDGAGTVTAIPVRHLSAPDSGVKGPPPEVAELRAARRGGRYAS